MNACLDHARTKNAIAVTVPIENAESAAHRLMNT